jgi:Na+-transporting NADH:ubiquinone oxidoreductase subunit C
MTIVIGGLLALASVGLGPQQRIAVELDTKAKILGSVMNLEPGMDILQTYESRIEGIVVNIDGEEVTTNEKGENLIAENIDIKKEYRKEPENRLYPVFKFTEENNDQVDAYIIPVFGNGLWDNIWGYIALETDLVTIRGAKFDHAAETPGLGARITEINVQDRFRGKKIYNDLGELVSVSMLKREGNPEEALDPHHVDGMSGATLTSKGVNVMLKNYFSYYKAYFDKVENNNSMALSNQ